MLGHQDRLVLESGRRPIVILPRRDDASLAPSIAPGNPYLGIMLPYTPLHAPCLAMAWATRRSSLPW